MAERPKPKMNDIEFVLVDREATPRNMKTPYRSNMNSRGGGVNDPKRKVSMPSPKPAKTAKPKQASPAPKKAVKKAVSNPAPKKTVNKKVTNLKHQAEQRLQLKRFHHQDQQLQVLDLQQQDLLHQRLQQNQKQHLMFLFHHLIQQENIQQVL